MINQPTVCGFCSCGCAMYIEAGKGGVAAMCPSANHPVSSGRLCIKGWNATPALLGKDRLKTPLIREGGALKRATWREAISFAASAIQRTDAKGIGVIGSPKLANEECYSLVKLARGVIGTPNVDSSCRFYDASLVPALLETTGIAASQIDVESVSQAKSMLVVGANVMDQLAHIGSRIQDAVENGCRVVVADPRVSRISPQTALYLQPKPGTDMVWLRALTKTIIDKSLYADGAPEITGFEELRLSLEDVTSDRLNETCGITPELVGQAAEMLAGEAPLVVMFGLGVLQQPGSTQIIKALADVSILLGGSIMPLRGQNNAQGACDMGLAHDLLPGYSSLWDLAARKTWESVLERELPGEPGMSAMEMLRGCQSGEIKNLLVFGENLALSAPNTEETAKALDKVEFLAVAEMYLTETAKLADVVFPACSFLEKDGTFTNIERRVQRVRKVFEPLGESKSDLAIISDLASALGKSLSSDPAAVMAEISSNLQQYWGVSYEGLDESWGKQWTREPGEARLAPLPASAVETDEEYPFKLIASRINYHQQTGAMCAKSSVLAREYPESYVELNRADAETLGIRAGRSAKITSRSGSVTRVVILSESVPSGCAHLPHYFAGDSPNALASYQSDPISGVPTYKAVPVKVEAVE